MNVLNKEKQAIVIGALAEGNSIRSIERMTGIHRDTIMRLGVKVGNNCKSILDNKMRNIHCSRIEVDEIWGFIGKKKMSMKSTDNRDELGDVWTFLSIDPDTKLMPSFYIGKRDRYHAAAFMDDLASRMANRIQLSSDALHAYPEAVDKAFGCDVDYGQIVKVFTAPVKEEQRRYSPGGLSAVYKTVVNGEPTAGLVSTSIIERANLTMRTHCKRLARLTLSFSKKLENFKAAIALNLAYYNFVKTHGSIRCTPAMQAGIEKTFWKVEDLMDGA